ncbi:MAG: class I SAM-dependent methyltransferase [Vicinamibacteria bacterium]|nr:class I SAM-dependent methyltransferase [Vicinamibacteria bacterium]
MKAPALDRELLRRGSASVARWSNLGLWDGTDDDDYGAACEALAAAVGRAAGVGPGVEVLDVACGGGASLRLWRALGASRVVGVDVQESAIADALSSGWPATELALADATNLSGFGDDGFDAVVSVDAAYHFAPRSAFLEEAARVLRPGGRVAWSDLTLPAGSAFRAVAPLLAIPAANLGPASALAAEAAAAGFVEVRVEALDGRVLEGFPRFAARLWREHRSLRPGFLPILATALALRALVPRGLGYTIVSGRRPGQRIS